MGQPASLTATLGIFRHHLYELSKGMRPLVLMTVNAEAAKPIVDHLVATGVAHHVHEACRSRFNVVFGRPAAVMAAQRFMVGPLCDLSPEHDFMLGILLGYDRDQQCLRYLARAEAAQGADPSAPAGIAQPEVTDADIAEAERAVMH
ncbi:DUF2023 family protein [Rhodoplanes roseus]|uniref:DUF2023 domain-containing protein n=1 Tax=Rhodoplanes roseus TaxID=29409 RepID=A0A327KZN8_9BRAD|nr:DUF2023 family protein [Rhodoplanes roseus]RAI42692.1 hypothetical protein CH341_18280 [Rhodoplanes roseus]